MGLVNNNEAQFDLKFMTEKHFSEYPAVQKHLRALNPPCQKLSGQSGQAIKQMIAD
ncbi:hypothetical protein PCANC_05103 [Puccinia coronata f. sp. avenae]|uniref:Uncharacterized protein n=1 Tax=Puccinia coronata f. sp. avenae TaxID=200324 RepID=A0A2N5W361_9BASI|nr:hypothetical protein PCANC_05103 [Puccinia coronata f. sp. avenae]